MDENGKERLEIALKLKNDENFEEAIKILEGLYSSNLDDEIVKNTLIETLFAFGSYLNDDYVAEYNKAIQHFKRIIQLDPHNYRTHYNLGIAYFNLNNFDDALNSCNTALKIKPDYKHCYYNIGLIYEAKDQLKTALEYYQKALDLDPNFVYAEQAIYDIKQRISFHKLFEN